MPRLIGVFLIAGWLAFAAAAPRLVTDGWLSVLALIGMALTIAVLAASGRLSRPDPLSLNLTARRPYWETRDS